MKADIYRCTWDSGWVQYHDDSEPLPTKWDSPPNEVAAFVLKIEAEAEITKLREALSTAEAALADIGDADREPGDDLAWCERRAAQALPAIRAALAMTANP